VTAWLLRARWWQVGLVSAVPLAVVIALVGRFARGESWTAALALGVVAGPLCGGVVGALTTARLREDADGVPPETYASVDRATRRGPVPTDPGERAAAHRLLTARLARIRATRTRSLVLQGALAVVGAALALTGSPWWWLLVVLAVVLLVTGPIVVARLERRAELLAGPPA
jgi:hypothetical protein